MQVLSLGWEDSVEEGTATNSSILVRRIPWTGEPGGPPYHPGLQRVRHNWSDLACTHRDKTYWAREKRCIFAFSDLQSFTVIPIPNSVKPWTLWTFFSCPKCILKTGNKWQYSESLHKLMKQKSFRSGLFFVALILQVWFEVKYHQPDLGSG